MTNKIIICLIIASFTFGCAKPPFEAFRPEPIVLAKAEPYNIQELLNTVPKPNKINKKFAKFSDQNQSKLVFVDSKAEADVFVLLPEEYSKIGQLKDLAVTYKEIIIEQEDLVNIDRKKINTYQNLVTLLEKERDVSLTAWENSENAYREEKRDHDFDNKVNKTSMLLLYIGSIIAVGLAL